MGPSMFGTWLVERDVVNAEDVVAALDRQRSVRIPIGKLAMQLGKLQIAQVFAILNVQAGSRRLFGEIAIDLGYLTAAEVGELLMEQQRRCPPIGAVLLDMGAIELETMAAELVAFQQSQPLSASDE